jgi:hypothetical protein
VKQNDTRDESLKQKPKTGPAVSECREESLQRCLSSEARVIRATLKPLIVGASDPTFGGSEGDNAAL